jgi:hypothetical protein
LLSPLDADMGDEIELARLHLFSMLQRIEVDSERRSRGLYVDGGSRLLTAEVCRAMGRQPMDHRGLVSYKEAAVCPTPSFADKQASSRARQIAHSPTKCCARYAPYLSLLASLRPPSRQEIEIFIDHGLGEAHSWYKHLPQNRGHPFWVFFTPQPRKNLKRQDTYRMLDWSSEGPPQAIAVDGKQLLTPPSVASGRDSLVHLSRHCFERSCSVIYRGKTVSEKSDHGNCPEGVMSREQTISDQSRLEHEEIVHAIERQCTVIWGCGWQAISRFA